MTPAEALAHYRAFIDEIGESVTIRRWYNTGAQRTKFEADVMARVAYESNPPVVGAVTQSECSVILLVDDLLRAQFPLPITTNDRVVIRGKEMTLTTVNDNTRRISGVLIAYELRVKG